MYKVEVDGHTIHDPRDENFILPYAKVDLELNKTGSFEFDITSKNPGYTYVDPMKSIISVYDDGKLIFRGRSTTKESDFYNTGTLKCEGELSYLIDTILRPRSSAFNNHTNRYIFQEALNEHNSQVNEEKQFIPGIVDVDSETISQISFNYEKPLDFINTNLIEKYGGYLRIRYADGKRYLDWVKQYGKVSKQPIRFGYNLLDLKKTLTSTDVCTVVVPVGGSDKKVTVKNAVVDGNVYGKDYIQNDEAISYFGKIIKVQEFSDIQEPTKLYTEGKKWLEENMKSSLTLELTAIDLHMVDLNIDDFKLGDLVPVISIPHEIVFNDDLPVIEKYSYDLTDPSKNTITVGKTLKVFTERKDKEIYERVQEVKGKFEGYVVTNDGKVEEIKENIQEYKALVLQDFTAVNGKIENLSGDFAAFKTGEFEELKAKQAELESVKGDFANFKTGEFESLKSKQADFETTTTENFTAVNAELEKVTGDFASFKTGEFEELKAKSSELETAVIGKADITDLDALRTRTGTLEADYSKLNTLVNGNLTSENIQNLNLTSLNTTIENGMIKNAMIESLTFDKITGIDINTSKLTVHSDDGKSTWTDNTIQIADTKRVRVQIGKDAKGDYNIYIWDKDGNLMFDPLYGVQESGIKCAIIRDDMVSDDANIQGSKLDIEDVIKEVNGAETTIKGTRIQLDEQNQTLDMAFSSLKTYAEGVNSKTETNTTAITVAQGQISSLISNTTIVKDGETVQLKDAYNNTVSDINSMKTTISEHTSLLDEQSGEILAVQTKANTIENGLDGTKQTISDVQSDLSGTKSRVTTVESGLDGLKTRVSDTETALTKKADGTTVDTLTNRVATCETTLDGFEVSLSETNKTVSDNYTSLANEIEETNATVATHTEQIALKVEQKDIDTAVQNIEVGGRNLLWNSNFSDSSTKITTSANKYGLYTRGNTYTATVDTTMKYNSHNSLKIVGTASGNQAGQDILWWINGIKKNATQYFEAGEQYVVSFYAKAASACTFRIRYAYGSYGDYGTFSITTEWKRYVAVLPKTITAYPNQIIFYITTAATMYLADVKFEKGNKATDWTPAPEDTDASITAVDNKFASYSTTSQMNSAITAAKNEINLSVSSTYATKSSVQTVDGKFANYSTTQQMNSAIQAKADSITQSVSATYATKSDLTSNVNTLKASLELKVNKDKLISEINASADVITLTGNRFIVNSDNFSLTADGTMTANNGIFSGSLNGATGSFSGNITATDGTIGAFKIDDGFTYITSNSELNMKMNDKGLEYYTGVGTEAYSYVRISFNRGSAIELSATHIDTEYINAEYVKSECAELKGIVNGNIDKALLWDNGTNLWIGGKQLADQDFYSGSISIACGGNIDFYSSYASSWSARINNAYGYCAQGEKGLYSTTMGNFVARYYISGSTKCTAIGNNDYATRIYGSSVWANKAISTSDERLKTDFRSLDMMNVFMELEPVSFRWKQDYEDGDNLIHFGLKAGQVKRTFEKYGYNTDDYSMIGNFGGYMGICYDDLFMLTMCATQKNTKELMYQAGKIDLHETIIQDLQNRIYQLEKQVKELKQAAV